MFGQTRRNSFENVFNFQREADRLFNQSWADVPARAFVSAPTYPFQVHTVEETRRVSPSRSLAIRSSSAPSRKAAATTAPLNGSRR